MSDQGTPEGNLRGTLFLKPCNACGELAELVNGLDPGEPRVCVGCAQEQIQERKLEQLQQSRATPTYWVTEPSPWRLEREREEDEQ